MLAALLAQPRTVTPPKKGAGGMGPGFTTKSPLRWYEEDRQLYQRDLEKIWEARNRRWRELLGIVEPDEFIPINEEYESDREEEEVVIQMLQGLF